MMKVFESNNTVPPYLFSLLHLLALSLRMEKSIATSRSSAAFLSIIKNPFKFRLFLLQQLPAAYFSGLKVEHVDEEQCTVSVPYKWFTRNPFRCTYFACLGMAAEMSTGILAMANVYKRKPKVSTLIVSMESKFYKRATNITRFTCTEGAAISEAIERAINLSEPQTVRVAVPGYNKEKELVAEFWLTWSFKARS
jgi:hypothetical protein